MDSAACQCVCETARCICQCPAENLGTLLADPNHWIFEIFLMVIFDGVVGALAWPFIKKHWKHHLRHDEIHRS